MRRATNRRARGPPDFANLSTIFCVPYIERSPGTPVQEQPANRSVGIGGDISIASAHPLDLLIALMSRRSKLFSRGWGNESLINTLTSRVSYHDPPSSITVSWTSAHVRAWMREGNRAAVVILAASRDEGYQVRERVFGPLILRGIDLYFMENPFYGLRRAHGG